MSWMELKEPILRYNEKFFEKTYKKQSSHIVELIRFIIFKNDDFFSVIYVKSTKTENLISDSYSMSFDEAYEKFPFLKQSVNTDKIINQIKSILNDARTASKIQKVA